MQFSAWHCGAATVGPGRWPEKPGVLHEESQAGKAEFTQSVTSPPTARRPHQDQQRQFEFQRPGKFRFNYTKPFEQLIVADGKTLWLYDADLNQVTQRPQARCWAARRRPSWPRPPT
jgi:hypothetical protein